MAKQLKLSLEYEVEVRDKEGKLITKVKAPSKSFVRHFLQAIRGLMYGNDNETIETIENTSNVGKTFPRHRIAGTPVFKTNAGAGEDGYGIQVGTSDIAVDIEDWALKARIVHGTGSGQLVYSASVSEAITVVGTEARFRISRPFPNNSGASITVKEIGIAFVIDQTTELIQYFLIVRDVLVSPVTIPDGATFTVRYTFKTTL